ncbi:MAG TPA: DNA replication/repair protein RecF [Afifellaceae bacterium]|nr:DNA replication/repair protein RecF [Afifellaceae bacterium]
MSAPAPEPDPVSVRLSALTLTNLRNYEKAALAFAGRLVVLTGPNGAGKTNLLEAVSLLSPGRGIRRAFFEAIARKGSDAGWAVSADVMRDGHETRIGTGTAGLAETGERGRRVRIDGAPATTESLLDHLRILWLTPAMDGLFTGPAGDRRRFLDRLVLAIDPGHGRRVAEFERLVTSRNRLLEENGDPGVLDAVEAQLAERAVAVSLARSETVDLLQAVLKEQGGQGKEPPFPVASIALQGDFETRIAGEPASRAEETFARDLAKVRARDRAAGRTLDGPHRSDLTVLFAAKEMPAALSSTGEQKALLTGLVLGHAGLVSRTSGMTPVLLLDEIAAHLDAARRAALFDRLESLACQAFMTGTDPELFAALEGRAEFFTVDAGRVEAAAD